MRLPATDLLPHERLLHACASVESGESARHALGAGLSAPDIDWPAVVVQGIRHGVAPLVARQMSAFVGDARLPAEIAACLTRLYRANARRNRALFQETGRLVRALEAEDIRCLVLKGVALALTVYPDPALRHFADIDILVDPANHEAAGKVLTACGFVRDEAPPSARQHHDRYTALYPEDILTETLVPEFDPTHAPDSLGSHRYQVVVELHRGIFRLASGFLREVDMAPFWACPQKARLPGGTPIPIPSQEAMLVHLAVHAADHIFRRLLFPLDMALVIGRSTTPIHWERVAALADLYGARASLYRMLECVRREFGVAIPDEALRGLRPGRAGQPLTVRAIFAAMQQEANAAAWQRFLLRANVRELLTACWQVLFLPAPTMQNLYGVRSPLGLPALYLWRPFHLAGRVVSALCQLAWRGRPAARAGTGGRATQPETERFAPGRTSPLQGTPDPSILLSSERNR